MCQYTSYISPTMNTEAAIKDNLPCETLATTSFSFIPLSYEQQNISDRGMCVCVCVCVPFAQMRK